MEGRMFFRSAAVPATVVAAIAFALPACAESCGKSRDYILSNAAGDLPKKPQVYQELFKLCVDTLQLPNVKDAFVLKAGCDRRDPEDRRDGGDRGDAGAVLLPTSDRDAAFRDASRGSRCRQYRAGNRIAYRQRHFLPEDHGQWLIS